MYLHELCISPLGLSNLVYRLRQEVRFPVVITAGLSTLQGHRRWLVHGSESQQRPREEGPQILMIAGRRADDLNRQVEQLRSRVSPRGPTLLLALGVEEAAGHVAGGCLTDQGLEPLRWLTLVGPGFFRTPLGHRARVEGPPMEVLSRTRGALGTETFERMRQLHVALVGCGRSGSLMAEGLASLGVAALTLIDPDTIELHNLGEMAGATPADVGRPKSTFLAALARRAPAAGQTRITAVIAPIQAPEALLAIKPADLIVSCPDNPAARLATGVLAAVYLKPLLDIGTGVVAVAGERHMGADVRLVLPGRCLLCLGSVPDLPAARDALLRGAVPQRAGDFRSERLGSLRSLNTLAVALGQTLLEQCITGLIASSVWLQVNVDAGGLPRITYAHAPPLPGCPLCARAAGGDTALQELRGVFRQL